MTLDPWTILDVVPGTDPAGIRAAYRRLAKTRHPDHGGTAGAMAQLTWAYQALADPAGRAAWESAANPGASPHASDASGASPRPGPPRAPGYTQSDGAPCPRATRRVGVPAPRLASRWGQWAASLTALGGLALLGHLGGGTAITIAASVLALVAVAERRPPEVPFWPALDALAALMTVVRWGGRAR